MITVLGLLTTLILAVQSFQVDCTEVQTLANHIVESRDRRGDGGDGGVLVEGERAVVHDGLIVIRRVQVRDKVVLVLVKIVLFPCGPISFKSVTNQIRLHASKNTDCIIVAPMFGAFYSFPCSAYHTDLITNTLD